MRNLQCLLATLLITLVNTTPMRMDGDMDFENLDLNSSSKTVHFFVLMVPETAVQEIQRARQDEDGGGIDVSDTGAYVGQIISGVLGGDVRPIFAGSASFIGEQDVQQGVSTILANVAPSLNNILKQWVNRAQTFLGIASTPKPGQLNNQTRPATGGAQTAQLQQQLATLQGQVRPQTNGGGDLSDITTPQSVTIVKTKPEEDEEESSKVV